jgi:hypothetical protein
VLVDRALDTTTHHQRTIPCANSTVHGTAGRANRDGQQQDHRGPIERMEADLLQGLRDELVEIDIIADVKADVHHARGGRAHVVERLREGGTRCPAGCSASR